MDPSAVLGHKFRETVFEYTERDVALYALGVGACGEVSCAPALPSTPEGGGDAEGSTPAELDLAAPRTISTTFRVLPTLAVLFPASLVDQILSLDSLQFDPALLLHGEQFLELFAPTLPTEAKVLNSTTIAGLQDKGKSAILEVETESRDAASGQPLALNVAACVLRGAGGFSSRMRPADAPSLRSRWGSPVLPLASKPPSSPPLATVTQHIPPTQALLYRLSGDYNPLHADPTLAAAAGFPQPILHGLCTLGFAIRALLLSAPRLPPAAPSASAAGPGSTEQLAVKRLRARFLSHVFPGETLVTHIWGAQASSPHQVRAALITSAQRGGKLKAVLAATVELQNAEGSGAPWAVPGALKALL